MLIRIAFICRKRTKPHPPTIDIATQAQMNTWTKTFLPMSRENSSHNLKVAGANLKNVLTFKRTPGISMTKIGKTFAGLNPISKVRLAKFRPPKIPGFVPAVLYRKSDADDMANSTTSLENAKILKGDHIIMAEEAFATDKDMPIVLGSELNVADLQTVLGTSFVDSHLELEPEEGDGEVLLQSCGILAVKPSLLLTYMLRQQRTKSASSLFKKETHHRTSSFKSQIYRKRQRIAAYDKSKSMDIDDKYGMEALYVDKTRVGLLTPQSEESKSPPSGAGSPKDGDGMSPPEGYKSPPQIHMSPPEVTVRSPEEGNSISIDTMFAAPSGKSLSAEDIPKVVCPKPIKPGTLNTIVTAHPHQTAEPINNAELANSITFAAASQVTSDEVIEPLGPPVVAGKPHQILPSPSPSDTIDETWVNLEYSDASEFSELIHPCMKMSLSDGSISYNADIDALGLISSGELKIDSSNSGALSRFRVKMSNLALPTIPSPQTRRRLQEQSALQNKVKSQVRFKECKTQIYLL